MESGGQSSRAGAAGLRPDAMLLIDPAVPAKM